MEGLRIGSMVQDGARFELACELYKRMRVNRGAPLTESEWDRIKTSARQSNIELNEALAVLIDGGPGGAQSKWLASQKSLECQLTRDSK